MSKEKEHLENIIEILNAHKVAMDWYYNEKLTEEEYRSQIGEYEDYNPEEIIEKLQDYMYEELQDYL